MFWLVISSLFIAHYQKSYSLDAQKYSFTHSAGALGNEERTTCSKKCAAAIDEVQRIKLVRRMERMGTGAHGPHRILKGRGP